MGCWDCYCAICGGPFGAQVSRKPRTARFRKRWARKLEQCRERGLSDVAEVSSDEEEPEDDTESLDDYDEDNYYDPEVISEAEVSWTETLHILGFNPDAKGASKAFLAGPGTYMTSGSVDIVEGSDPNAEGIDDGMLSCYYSYDPDDPVFPFHMCCYEILAKHHSGSFDVGKLDKALMFSIMRELAPEYSRSLEELDYGAVSSMQQQFWRIEPGYEYLVSHPRDAAGVEEIILSMFGSNSFVRLASDTSPGERVKSDPFTRLPYDLVYRVSTMLEDGDLLNLVKASWPVNALLRDAGQFWQQRLKRSMPWFVELQALLEQDQTLLEECDPKRVFLWAEKMTRPRRWLTGPIMGVANRRRIWSVCEQLGERYFCRLVVEEPVQSSVEKMIMDYSYCSSFVTTSAPESAKIDIVRSAYWFCSWSGMRSERKSFTTFWDGASLAGISLGVEGRATGPERRLIGRDDSKGDVYGDSMRLQENEWITGVILHIPTLDICSYGWWKNCPTKIGKDVLVTTSPEGLTIILNTGEKRLFGTKKRGFSQRYLPVAPNWYLTGMTGLTGEVVGKQQFIRLGLLQARQPEPAADDSVLPGHDEPPEPTLFQSLLWDEDYSDVLQHSIWDHPTLELVYEARDFDRYGGLLHEDLVPHEALVWARDQQDLRSLRRISGFSLVGGTFPKPRPGGETNVDSVCGVSAEYSPESALMRRVIGISKRSPGSEMKHEDPWRHFEIDGPGGEMITEVQYAMRGTPKAMKIRTNRGRECYWGEAYAQDWQTLRAPPGATLVGLVMVFADPRGYDHERKVFGAHCNMRSVAALSMPLGIPEESQLQPQPQPVGE